MQTRFHIMFEKRRTTVSVDNILSEMMTIKLGTKPGGEEGHRVVREWLQETLPQKLGTVKGRKEASQWARRYLIEALVDKKISNKWTDWKLKYI